MIYLGADRHGFTTISFVTRYLQSHKISYQNMGIQNSDQDIALEDLIPSVVEKVLAEADAGAILSCGTGIGIEVGANKFSGIRACLATSGQIAQWARVYDKCNVLCCPAGR